MNLDKISVLSWKWYNCDSIGDVVRVIGMWHQVHRMRANRQTTCILTFELYSCMWYVDLFFIKNQSDWKTKPWQVHPFNGRLPGTTRVSRYQKGKANLDFNVKARDSEWQWHRRRHHGAQRGTCPPLLIFVGTGGTDIDMKRKWSSLEDNKQFAHSIWKYEQHLYNLIS